MGGHGLSGEATWPESVSVRLLRVWVSLCVAKTISAFLSFGVKVFYVFSSPDGASAAEISVLFEDKFGVCMCVFVETDREKMGAKECVWALKRQRSRFERFTWLRFVPSKPPAAKYAVVTKLRLTV